MLLPVDDDRGGLLVHEEEDGEKQGRDGGKEVNLPLGSIIVEGD